VIYSLSVMRIEVPASEVGREQKLSLLLSRRPDLLTDRDKALAMGQHLCREARGSERAQCRFILFDTSRSVAACMFKDSCAHADQCEVAAS